MWRTLNNPQNLSKVFLEKLNSKQNPIGHKNSQDLGIKSQVTQVELHAVAVLGTMEPGVRIICEAHI